MARDIPGEQGRADEQLVVGYRVLSKSVLKSINAASAAFESQRPGRTVRLLASRGGDVTCGLAEGQADLALVHLPLSLDLAFEELERHPFVVIAHKTPETHRREAYDLDELRHRRFILRPSNDGAWNEEISAVVARIPDAQVFFVDDEYRQLVAIRHELAMGVSVWPPQRPHPVGDLTTIVLNEVPPAPYGIAWPSGGPSPAAKHFLDLLVSARSAR